MHLIKRRRKCNNGSKLRLFCHGTLSVKYVKGVVILNTMCTMCIVQYSLLRQDEFSGLSIIADTYSNHNGPHNHQVL